MHKWGLRENKYISLTLLQWTEVSNGPMRGLKYHARLGHPIKSLQGCFSQSLSERLKPYSSWPLHKGLVISANSEYMLPCKIRQAQTLPCDPLLVKEKQYNRCSKYRLGVADVSPVKAHAQPHNATGTLVLHDYNSLNYVYEKQMNTTPKKKKKKNAKNFTLFCSGVFSIFCAYFKGIIVRGRRFHHQSSQKQKRYVIFFYFYKGHRGQ